MIKKNTDERRIRSNYSLSFMHLLISHFLTFTCWGLYNSPGGSRDWQTSSIASSTCLVGGQSSPQCHRWNGPLLKHTEILNITMTWLKKAELQYCILAWSIRRTISLSFSLHNSKRNFGMSIINAGCVFMLHVHTFKLKVKSNTKKTVIPEVIRYQ